MQYRKNKYGEPISVLGFGCMRFARKGTGIDLEERTDFSSGVRVYAVCQKRNRD